MSKLLKLAVYVAAGVGTYEVLRRTGLLQKAGQWLSDQVPDEYKDQARQYVDQARDRANQVGGQVRDRVQQVGEQVRQQVGEYGEQAQNYANQANSAVKKATGYDVAAATGLSGGGSPGNGSSGSSSNGSNGHTGGPQNLTGPGRGTQSNVDEGTGVHASHTVGRGVVR